jgi:60 kDa SS-A/Ro ribonucleoprotein
MGRVEDRVFSSPCPSLFRAARQLIIFFYIIYLFSLLFLFFTRRVSLFVVIIEVFVEKMEDDMFKLLPFSRRKGSAAMHYTGFGKRAQATPQTEPIPGSQQVANNAGGFSFQIDDMQRLQRFLILGSSSNTYYTKAKKLTKENLDAVERLLEAGRGKEVVEKIVELSDAGRAVSNDPALFALARCCAADDAATRRYAYEVLPRVARISTHLLHFMEYVKQFRGRGRIHRRAIRDWYDEMPLEKLAYQAVKYQQRDGWAQRDVLRLARPKVEDARNELYHWIVKGEINTEILAYDPLAIIRAYEQAKKAPDDKEVARLIKEYRLPREAVPTEHLRSVRVWEALLEDMPLEAMMRNLAKMTKNGTLEPMSSTFTQSVVARLRNRDAIHKARLHPIKILAALMTYQSGMGVRGDATWTPLTEIIDALNDAFYLAFEAVQPSNKRLVLALDVSSSMSRGMVGNTPALTPRVASAAMALVTAATEPHHMIMAFSTDLVRLNISPKQRLDDVVKATSELPFGGTDCAQPMLWAMEHKVQADVFVVYTDSETWAGKIHPTQALALYRQRFGIPAKLVVVGMVSNGFSIADPDDAGMLDVVGFDTATPELVSSFVRGDF